MDKVEAVDVDAPVLLPRCHQLRRELRGPFRDGANGRQVVVEADLGLERGQLIENIADRGGEVQQRVTHERGKNYVALFIADALPAVELAERRVGIPEPVV